jgi:hypothetical protein
MDLQRHIDNLYQQINEQNLQITKQQQIISKLQTSNLNRNLNFHQLITEYDREHSGRMIETLNWIRNHRHLNTSHKYSDRVYLQYKDEIDNSVTKDDFGTYMMLYMMSIYVAEI